MAWIESHQELGDHPKTKRLARILDVSVVQVVGHLHFLWWWALSYADNGILTGMESYDIADAARWQGDAELFLSAMMQAGFLERIAVEGGTDLTIHDWWDYAGRLVLKRKANAKRMREARAAGVQGTCDARVEMCEATVPTVPTVPTNKPHLRGEPTGSQKRAMRDSVPTERPTDAPMRRGAASQTEQQTAMPKKRLGGAEPSTEQQTMDRRTMPAVIVRPLFSVLARRCEYDLARITNSERGEINKAAVTLAQAEYSPEQVLQMADNWSAVMGDCMMTPSAIAKHATRLLRSPGSNGRERFGRKPVTEAPPSEEYSEAKHRD